MRRIMFSLEGGQLVMRQTPILVEMTEDEQNHPLVLAKDVKSFKVEAMDPQKGDWTDEWEQTNQIPSMVRISLKFINPPEGARYSSREGDEVQFEVALPSIAVQPSWQKPSMGGNPAVAPGLQGQW